VFFSQINCAKLGPESSETMPSLQNILVLAVLAVTIALFLSEKLRVDVIALCVLGALLILKLISPAQALYGFGNQATAIVTAMFILSAGLVRTGIVDWLARKVDRLAGGGRLRLLIVLCLTTALLSAFIVNSAVVAIFIPITFILAEKRKIPVSKVLIPMAFASQLGGACTLIGSSTHILVNAVAQENGQEGFGLFEFAPLGLIVAAAGVAALLLFSGILLPRRRGDFQKKDKYRLADYLGEFSLDPKSSLIGKRWDGLDAESRPGIKLIKVLREGKAVSRAGRTVIREKDILLIHGDAKNLLKFKDAFGLKTQADIKIDEKRINPENVNLIEALIPPRSILSGRTLDSSDFTRRFKCTVLAVQRREKTLRQRIDNIRLEQGDTLLLQCDPDDISRIKRSRDLIMTEELSDLRVRKDKAVIALSILVLVVGLAAFSVLPILTAALLGAVGMLVTGCLSPDEAYQAVDWQVIVLLGGILPLGLAMQQSGTAHWLVETVLKPIADLGPYAVLAALYLLTALCTEGMSNATAAILMAPIAFSLAGALGVSPRPFLVAITFAASTSFATPIGYQTNTMIYAPGGYRFTDFTRLGVPINLLFWAIAVPLIPVFWPF
jgi:di/tricarboxylate transporter